MLLLVSRQESQSSHRWRPGETLDLASDGMRQRGIQEVNGVELCGLRESSCIDSSDQFSEAVEMVVSGLHHARGPFSSSYL